MKVHPVFHHSLLSKDAPPALCDPSTTTPTLPVMMEGEPEYKVEEILDFRRWGKGIQYLTHWKSYPVFDRSWENTWYVYAPNEIVHIAKIQLGKKACALQPIQKV